MRKSITRLQDVSQYLGPSVRWIGHNSDLVRKFGVPRYSFAASVPLSLGIVAAMTSNNTRLGYMCFITIGRLVSFMDRCGASIVFEVIWYEPIKFGDETSTTYLKSISLKDCGDKYSQGKV